MNLGFPVDILLKTIWLTIGLDRGACWPECPPCTKAVWLALSYHLASKYGESPIFTRRES